MANRTRPSKPAVQTPAPARDLFGEELGAGEVKPDELVGLREYAQRRGCRQRDVQDAIARGVLRASVRVHGTRRFLVPELADREWVAAEPEQPGSPLEREPVTAGELARSRRPKGEGPTLLGVRAYARHRGVSEASVRDAIARGRLRESVQHVGQRRMIDPAIADPEWEASTDVVAAERGARPKTAAARDEDVGERVGSDDELLRALDEEDGRETDAVFMAERAARERWSRRRERLEVLKLRGELIEKAEVDRRAFSAARVVRDALKGLPDRLAPVLAPAMPAGEVGRILEREIAQALEEIGAHLRARVHAAAG